MVSRVCLVIDYEMRLRRSRELRGPNYPVTATAAESRFRVFLLAPAANILKG